MSKKNLVLAYGFFAFWLILIFILRSHFALAPWFLMMTFFFLTLTPGYFLSRIFTIELKDLLGDFLLWFALGLIFNFLLALMAMILGLTIDFLNNLLLILLAVVFFSSFFFELSRIKKQTFLKTTPTFKWQVIFQKHFLLLCLMIVLIIPILIIVDSQGSNFRGDPYFHLAIMRKIFDGQKLLPENLGFIKNAQIHPAYGFPPWHIFLSTIAKLIHSNIFTVWSQICLSLTILVFLTWYWLYRQILPTRGTAIVAFTIFVIFTFRYQDGYFFTRLAVPDTLNQLLILPLSIGLALKYIFDKKTDYKLLLVLSFFLLMMAAIHFTQYFYYLLIMTVFLIVYLLSQFRSDDYKPTLKRIFWAIFGGLLILLPLVVLMEYHGRIVSQTIKSFWNSTLYKKGLGKVPFVGVPILAKYAYISIPLILIFVRKYQRILFLLALFLVMPLAYSQTIGSIRFYLIKILGNIFFSRLTANVTWEHALWGLFLGFFLVVIDRLIFKLLGMRKNLRWFINLIFLCGTVGLIYLEQTAGKISTFYKRTLVSDGTIAWLNQNYYWLIIGLGLLTLVILLWQKYSPKVKDFFSFQEFRYQTTAFLMFFPIIFFLFSPNYKNSLGLFKNEFKEKKFFITSRDRTTEVIDIKTIGGWQTVDFIRNNLPAKSIILADKTTINIMPLLVDQFMAANPRTLGEKESQRIFGDISLDQKLAYLQKYKIDYLFLRVPEKEGEAFFDEYPQYFQKIYNQNVVIYEVKNY